MHIVARVGVHKTPHKINNTHSAGNIKRLVIAKMLNFTFLLQSVTRVCIQTEEGEGLAKVSYNCMCECRTSLSTIRLTRHRRYSGWHEYLVPIILLNILPCRFYSDIF